MNLHPWKLATVPPLLVLVAAPSVSRADLKICNETSERHSVAIGYSENKVWTSEGWWNIDAGSCKPVVSGDLKNRYYYYRANGKSGKFEGEGYMFCTSPKSFTIEGDEKCSERGYDRQNFRKIDTGKAKDFTVTFNYGTETAPPKTTAPGTTAPRTAPPKAAAPSTSGYSGPPDSIEPAGGAEPGRYGEPLSVAGVFLGCDSDSGPYICRVENNDGLYAIVDDDRTPKAIFSYLDSLPLNTEVSVSGDLVNFGDMTVEMTARRAEILHR